MSWSKLRIPERAPRRLRLDHRDVERREGNVAAAQRLGHGSLVDGVTAADIDECAARLHRGNRRGVDHVDRLGGIRHGQDNRIGERQQAAQIHNAMDLVKERCVRPLLLR
jgi:hypothetical protein